VANAQPTDKEGEIPSSGFEPIMPPVIAAAIVEIQKKLKELERSAQNDEYGSGYTPLDVVAPMAMKLLTKRNIAVIQSPTTNAEGHLLLETTLVHKDGLGFSRTTRLALEKANPQGHGSAITYMRRYALMAMLGMVSEGEDDDGNKASGVVRQATDEQRDRITSLLRHLKWDRDQIAAEQRNIRTYDHASEAIVNYERLMSMRAREREAEKAALEAEKMPTRIHIQQDKTVAERIADLGLKNKVMENRFIYEATTKATLGKCDEDDLAILDKVLNQIEAGEIQLPANWYPEGKAPTNALPPEEDNGDDSPGDNNHAGNE
jgi:hypothetical protein